MVEGQTPTVAAHDPVEAQRQLPAAGTGGVRASGVDGVGGTVMIRPGRARQLRGRQGGGPGVGIGPITLISVCQSDRPAYGTLALRSAVCGSPVTTDRAPKAHHQGSRSEASTVDIVRSTGVVRPLRESCRHGRSHPQLSLRGQGAIARRGGGADFEWRDDRDERIYGFGPPKGGTRCPGAPHRRGPWAGGAVHRQRLDRRLDRARSRRRARRRRRHRTFACPTCPIR